MVSTCKSIPTTKSEVKEATRDAALEDDEQAKVRKMRRGTSSVITALEKQKFQRNPYCYLPPSALAVSYLPNALCSVICLKRCTQKVWAKCAIPLLTVFVQWYPKLQTAISEPLPNQICSNLLQPKGLGLFFPMHSESGSYTEIYCNNPRTYAPCTSARYSESFA